MSTVAPASHAVHALSSHLNDDKEVEDILNELGIFGDSSAGLDDFPATFFPSEVTTAVAPVSPDNQGAALGTDFSRHYSVAEITPSTSMENMSSFSVPNPMANLPPSQAAPLPQVTSQAAVLQSRPKPKSKTTVTKKVTNAKTAAVRKRKLSATVSVSSMSSKEENMSEGEMEERRQRNREHAKRSRLRKKSLTQQLQQSLESLKQENSKLRVQVFAMIGQRKALSAIESRKQQAQDRFVAHLANPQNRVLDDSTISVLKSLQKNLTAPSATPNPSS